jgi:hypothetical protein
VRVNNDATVDRGVFTATGQETVRDILADNNPALPTQYAYGRGQSDPATGDTALDDQAATLSLGEIVVQTADTNSEFNNVTPTFADNTPLAIRNGAVELLQAGFLTEGENMIPGGSAVITTSGINNSSQGGAAVIDEQAGPDSVEFTFSNEYVIPQGSAQFALRVKKNASDNPSIQIFLDGNRIFDTQQNFLGSRFQGSFDYLGPFGGSGFFDSDISTGSHTVRIQIKNETVNRDDIFIDFMHISDNRFSFTFDNNTDTNDNLTGPELFPDLQEFTFNPTSTRRPVDSVTETGAFNDVSNNQFIEVSNDGGATFQRFNNTASATGNFADSGQAPQARIGLSRFGSRTTATPSTGFNGQSISTHELVAVTDGITPNGIGSANVRAIAPTGDLSAESEQLREGGQLDANGDLLTRSIFPPFPIGNQTRVESSEETRFTRE